MGSLLGDYFTILQQNAVINAPTTKHFQTAGTGIWLSAFVASKPLAISALFCIDDFSEVTGGTMFCRLS